VPAGKNYVLKLKEEQNIIFNVFENTLFNNQRKIRNIFSRMESYLQQSLKEYSALEYKVRKMLPKILENQLVRFKQAINSAEIIINQNNPERNLKLGYSLVRKNGKIIRKIDDVEINDDLSLQVSDGIITSQVKNKSKKGK